MSGYRVDPVLIIDDFHGQGFFFLAPVDGQQAVGGQTAEWLFVTKVHLVGDVFFILYLGLQPAFMAQHVPHRLAHFEVLA